jgi:exodeoxyribonuclease VIII
MFNIEHKLGVEVDSSYDLGEIEGLSNEQYHASPGISSSDLKYLADKTPMHLRYKWEHHDDDGASKAFDFGTAIHTAILEFDHLYNRCIVVPSDAPRRPTDAQRDNVARWRAMQAERAALEVAGDADALAAFKKANKQKPPAESSFASVDFWANFEIEAAGRLQLTNDQWEALDGIRKAVNANAQCQRLFAEGGPERSFAACIDGALVRCRPDWYHPGGLILDVKSCQDASPAAFAKDIARYRYDMQAAFYLDVMRHAGFKAERFIFLAVEKTARLPRRNRND